MGALERQTARHQGCQKGYPDKGAECLGGSHRVWYLGKCNKMGCSDGLFEYLRLSSFIKGLPILQPGLAISYTKPPLFLRPTNREAEVTSFR